MLRSHRGEFNSNRKAALGTKEVTSRKMCTSKCTDPSDHPKLPERSLTSINSGEWRDEQFTGQTLKRTGEQANKGCRARNRAK